MKKPILTASLILLSFALFAQTSKNMVQRSHLRFPGKKLANICGYVDSLGNEYALVGTSTGMTIVDVTNPDSVFAVASFPGPTSTWREIKTWQHYAYVTTEGGGGLQIVDMQNLPGTILPYHNWAPTISGLVLGSIHALHIDNGFAYLYGANVSNGGFVIADLTDPWNPTYAGQYDDYYVHDGYVRHDTVWAGQIGEGSFAAINVSNKANPVVLGSQQTPNAFTHNTWLSDNSKYLFATDEVDNSYLSAYDVSNVNNIIFMDKVQSQHPGSFSIIHNTHILNDYAITAWYRDGVVITDCHRPQNLVNVGYIDDCQQSGSGFSGVWGAYPFLPSGTIVASDMDSGLFVYTPAYVRACYLEGFARDSICNTLINNVRIELTGTAVADFSDYTGQYRIGIADSGTYMAVFSKPGYVSRTIPVNLNHGIVTNLNVKLFDSLAISYSGNVSNSGPATGISGAIVQLSGTSSYVFLTDTSGNYYNCVDAGQYTVSVGKWGYLDSCIDTIVSAQNNNLNVSLAQGYFDEFSLDYGWTVNSTTNFGIWTRATPSGTFLGAVPANPGSDAGSDCLGKAFVTGSSGSGTTVFDNVGYGHTILTSPAFDLTTFTQPYLNYSRWFYDGGTNANDTMHISISNGNSSFVLETITSSSSPMSEWIDTAFNLSGLIAFTSNMKFSIKIADLASANVLEGGLDAFRISEGPLGNLKSDIDLTAKDFTIYPNPSNNFFTLSLKDIKLIDGSESLLVTDISGRVIEKINVDAEKIVFGKNLKSGIYFVTLNSNGNNVTQKIVKF